MMLVNRLFSSISLVIVRRLRIDGSGFCASLIAARRLWLVA